MSTPEDFKKPASLRKEAKAILDFPIGNGTFNQFLQLIHTSDPEIRSPTDANRYAKDRTVKIIVPRIKSPDPHVVESYILDGPTDMLNALTLVAYPQRKNGRSLDDPLYIDRKRSPTIREALKEGPDTLRRLEKLAGLNKESSQEDRNDIRRTQEQGNQTPAFKKHAQNEKHYSKVEADLKKLADQYLNVMQCVTTARER